MRVAFLGLGVMGFPMAGHLKARGGHEVTVYNRTRAKAETWVQKHGGRAAATPLDCRKSIWSFISAISGEMTSVTPSSISAGTW